MEKKTCSKCGGSNISYQAITNTVQKNAHHSLLWWLCIGWWWILIKWVFFFGIAVFMFILKLCGVRRKKTVIIDRTKAVCQDCGNTWTV